MGARCFAPLVPRRSSSLGCWSVRQSRSAGQAPGGRPTQALGSSFSAAELMQYLRPVGSGPSSKTCPRCPPHVAHVASVRVMKMERSVSVATAAGFAGAKKLGQPVPDSNFASDPKSSASQPAHRYTPARCSSHNSPLKARSVLFSRSTRYWFGVSSARHSASDLEVGGVVLGSIMVTGYDHFVANR